MIQVNRIYLIFNRLVTKKFLVDTSAHKYKKNGRKTIRIGSISITFAFRNQQIMRSHAQ